MKLTDCLSKARRLLRQYRDKRDLKTRGFDELPKPGVEPVGANIMAK
jgi:hypothetical protein